MRKPISLALATCIIILLYLFRPVDQTWAPSISDISLSPKSKPDLHKVVSGKPIMSKMTNQTIRAELGRSSWKLFHTILAQYPEEPTPEDRETLTNYIYLFSRVYPCRECAEHFQDLLKEFPPQTATREIASQWGCHVHNQVNKRLDKPIFDCSDLSDKYMCGCSEEEGDEEKKEKSRPEQAEEPQFQHGG